MVNESTDKLLAWLAVAAAFWGCGCDGGRVRTEATVMTFNVLCSFCNPDFDSWEERLVAFGDILRRHDPDLIGLQELTWPEEVQQFRELVDGYRAVYFEGDEAGPWGLVDYPDSTILYRSDRFESLEQGFYWLSPTPDETWSTGFSDGLQFSRIAAWVLLEERSTERQLLFVTTHFDNNPPSQDLSAPLLLERTASWAERMPVIVTGDFNSQPYDPAYHTLVQGVDGSGFCLENAFDYASQWSKDSNQDPVPDYDVDGRIDHIFTAGQGVAWECPVWTVDLHVYGQNQMYPSDHLAISARLSF